MQVDELELRQEQTLAMETGDPQLVESPGIAVVITNTTATTALGKFLVCDDLPLNDTCDCLPPK